jgi:type IV pilus assembly protein PilA
MLRFTSRLTKGFTLIELMIVVAIIGILAAIAIPNFVKFQCKAKQSEAKTALKAIYTVELAYTGEFGSVLNLVQLTGFGGLDSKTVTGARYYRYSITVLGGGDSFDSLAIDEKVKVNTSGSNDQWEGAEDTPAPENKINACR